MVGSSNAEVSPDGKMLGVIYSAATRPPEVYLMPNEAGAKMTQVTTSTSDAWRSLQVGRRHAAHVRGARRRSRSTARLYTPEMVGAKRRSGGACRGVRARRGLSAERAQVAGRPISARTMFHHHARVEGLRRARRRLSRQRRATAATGAPRSTVTWAARISRTSSTARISW